MKKAALLLSSFVASNCLASNYFKPEPIVTIHKSKRACLRALNAWADSRRILIASEPRGSKSALSLAGPKYGDEREISYAWTVTAPGQINSLEMSCEGRKMTESLVGIILNDIPPPPETR
jgi:hypothetical protein